MTPFLHSLKLAPRPVRPNKDKMSTQAICLALAIVLLCPFASAQWVQANGPYFGSINCFAVSGTNLFAGTGCGVFRSTDTGTSWTQTALTKNVGCLAVSGTNLFAGTGGGVFRSTDTGTSWTQTALTKSVSCLAVSGTNLFACTDSGIVLSTNNGSSWTAATTPFQYFIQMVQMDTNLFAVADSIVPFGGRVYHSTDNGMNWTAVDGGLSNRQVTALAISGTNLFGVTRGVGPGYSSYVFLSTNCGTDWTEMGSGIPWAVGPFVATNAGTLLAGTYRVERGGVGVGGPLLLSANNGVDWTQVSDIQEFVGALAVSGTNLFAGSWTTGKVFLSTDDGTNWRRVGIGLWDQIVTALAESHDEAGRTNLFVGTERVFGSERGVYLSTDNGTNWTTANTPFGVFNQIVQSGTNLFAGGWGVFRSTDNGSSWTAVNTGLPLQFPYDSTQGYAEVAALAVSDTKLFAGIGNHGVYRSTNDGTSWTAVNTGLRNPYDTTQYYGASAFAVNGTKVFALASGVFLSTNYGTNWIPAASLTPPYAVSALAVSGTNLYAGTGTGGVFLSTNDGTSWTSINTGFPKAVVDTTRYCGVHAFAVSGTNLFAGTDGGVSLSTNAGASWTEVNSGLPNNVGGLIISGTNLFACGQYNVFGVGLWRRPLTEMITSDVGSSLLGLPTGFSLSQNYPNPFNPSTKIQFTIANRQLTVVKVFDLLGRDLATLVNEVKQPGTYTVQFDGSDLASGAYFYRIQAGDFVSTKKLLIVK